MSILHQCSFWKKHSKISGNSTLTPTHQLHPTILILSRNQLCIPTHNPPNKFATMELHKPQKSWATIASTCIIHCTTLVTHALGVPVWDSKAMSNINNHEMRVLSLPFTWSTHLSIVKVSSKWVLGEWARELCMPVWKTLQRLDSKLKRAGSRPSSPTHPDLVVLASCHYCAFSTPLRLSQTPSTPSATPCYPFRSFS